MDGRRGRLERRLQGGRLISLCECRWHHCSYRSRPSIVPQLRVNIGIWRHKRVGGLRTLPSQPQGLERVGGPRTLPSQPQGLETQESGRTEDTPQSTSGSGDTRESPVNLRRTKRVGGPRTLLSQPQGLETQESGRTEDTPQSTSGSGDTREWEDRGHSLVNLGVWRHKRVGGPRTFPSQPQGLYTLSLQNKSWED